ncbi:hypothetical protein JQC91_16025 [Jannaschia sp. Os4]|uniref:hypothetical protein n=1 Tax=Jannaschia sp. Os4 TaxID=2807617 RepID=UPI00193A1690|nr:hypothetical protein [Jannaschia sp. Os4]MBM2577815.1 hypothetical protein [Jannaschia sp. Os4]
MRHALPLLLLAAPALAQTADDRALAVAEALLGAGPLDAADPGPALVAALDADGDGMVSRGEWIAMAPGGTPLVAPEARTAATDEGLTQIFDRMDADGEVAGASVEGGGAGDGVLTAEELGAAAAVGLAEADLDADGRVTAAEAALAWPLAIDLAPILALAE